jgi:hypothetical protein
VLIECRGKIGGGVGEAELGGRVQARYCDLQQQSDRGKHSTEPAAEPVSPFALLSPQPYRHIYEAHCKPEMTGNGGERRCGPGPTTWHRAPRDLAR